MDQLLEALLLPEPQARHAWEQWRAGIDVDSLSYASQQLFPALNPVFPEWLEHDPAARIFKGIVRQVWSQNQLRLRRAVDLHTLLTHAGVRPVIVGPLAWSLRTQAPAIRAIPHLTLLAPRRDVRKAADALVSDGWELGCDLPSDQAWDRRDHVSFRHQDLELKLHWRLVPAPPDHALECEKALLSRVDRIEWNQHMLWTTSPEVTLLHILCGQHDRDLPWQADVALAGTAGIDWMFFLELARRFGPLAIERLRELGAFSRFAIPPLASNEANPVRRKFRNVWRAYQAHSYYRKEALSWQGFAEFLAVALARKCMHAAPSRFGRK